MQEYDYILKMEHICKEFPGVIALDDVQLHVKKGTVHAIMGENGAGKSTLMKVLLGIYKKDAGTINFRGEAINFKGPSDALQKGIAMIHQELSTVQDLTVAENIFLGKELTLGKTMFTRKKAMVKKTKELFGRLNMDIDAKSKMRYLSVAQQQMCEIAKAISYNADLIIMDEPTSAITETEVEHLFSIIRDLVEHGITIIYITHKMDEVWQITDEITVYRDGKYIGNVSTQETTRDQLVEMMVGRQISDQFPKEHVEIGDVYLRVEGLSREGEFEDVSFDVHRGEILGVAGLMGAGRSEIMETLFGVRKKSSGKIFIDGKEIRINNPSDAIKNNMALLTEDRKRSGCFLPLSVRLNTYVAAIQSVAKGPLVDYKKTVAVSEDMKNKLSIKTPSLEQKIVNLSGGNQQKVLVGRWLLTKPDILIIDEPTRGIDVGAKAEIHKLICSLAKEGKCVIMISSELPEILGMSDRIMVVSGGKVTGFLNADEATQEKILLYATGQTE
ncbi:MAG: sugar ABC transporter ATP-binding protein [Christensenellales bacterium]|jgi:inositol transport system ATP-binding protein